MYRGERLNSITHLLGAALALAGLALLVVPASRQGDPWKIVSFAVYGVSLLLLYTSSTLYHSLRGRAKRILRRLDHSAIYLLIAGSYTPFALVALRGPWGWSLFGVIWGLALLGIIQELWLARGARVLSLIIYLVMGWLVLIAIRPLAQVLPGGGLAWLVVGGVIYTAGVVFYALDGKLRHGHGIWHMFVLGGSASHFCAVFFYLA
ncbi:MAG: hemolysin III [Candidatus Muproteobacteria bacterium RIFCSPHIGHO2_01_FULL_65_16]|uniref:Hemolysin III n=2 Tax=Candidatus Muproteobacteria TaxID=1817795 RepID=A0A1F6TCU9_9PROT|nr:MAG: hemolysin III [Candidatus Muproteobacteria bacterium RBG_16_65_31]OGI47329.1 MAG: hemolysin III [Candidatus Muproteobacteria bacterium RIFCSPHIGHO2_01_FULL_65_16]